MKLSKIGVLTSFGRVITLLTLLPVVATVLFTSYASAQSSNSLNDAANTLKVSPVRSDVDISPGTTKSVEVIVTNLTNGPITVHPIENDFVAGDESGTPSLILDENQYASTHSLKRFMTPLTNVTIEAKASKIVNVVITVPQNAQAGGYFGALRFAPVSIDGGGQVNLSASVASLILVTVPGDTIEKLELTDYKILQDDKTGSFFLTPDDIKATVRFANKGNVQIGPFGKVTIKQGDKVVYDINFNQNTPKDVILPDSARRWDIPLDKDKLGSFGYFTVTGVFTYGKDNKTFEVSQSFWLVPLWMIITAIALVVAIVIVVLFIIFGRSKRRRARRSLGGGRLQRR